MWRPAGALSEQHQRRRERGERPVRSDLPRFVTDDTPQPVIDVIYTAVLTALRDPALVTKLDEMGFLPGGDTPSQFAESAKKEAAIWAETVAKGKLAVD